MEQQFKINKKTLNFFKEFKKHIFKNRATIISADETPNNVYYIISGKVKMCLVTKDGQEVVVNIFKKGSYFPMPYALTQNKNNYYFEAMQKTDVYVCPKEKVIAFLKINNDLMFDLLKRVFTGIDGVFMRMSYLMAGNAYKRVITEIVIAAKRFGEARENILIPFNQTALASFCGLTRETFSRQIALLKQKGIVTTQGSKLKVISFQNLERELFE